MRIIVFSTSSYVYEAFGERDDDEPPNFSGIISDLSDLNK